MKKIIISVACCLMLLSALYVLYACNSSGTTEHTVTLTVAPTLLADVTTAAAKSRLTSSDSAPGVNATSALMKIYKIYLSPNGDCSSPVVIYNAEGTAPGYKLMDMAQASDMANVSVAEGNYKCVIFKMSDTLTITPESDEGTMCHSGVPTDIGVCQSGLSTKNPETGEVTACTSGEDTVWFYVSTFSTRATSACTGGCTGGFIPPLAADDPNDGYHLDAEVNLVSDITGTFIFDILGKVKTDTCGVGGAAACCIDPPDIHFIYAPTTTTD
jgi:hypothetical protein